MRRSICTRALRTAGASLLALATLAAPSAAVSDGPRLRGELRLAQEPGIYLVLSPAAGELTVKARGVELDRIPLQGVWLRHAAPWLGPSAPPSLGAPAVLTVRRAPLPAAEPAPGGATDDDEAPAPVEVEALLDGGLALRAVASAPPTGAWRRLTSTLGAAWAGLAGRGAERLPALVLQVAPADVARLGHLLERDRRILLLDARPAR